MELGQEVFVSEVLVKRGMKPMEYHKDHARYHRFPLGKPKKGAWVGRRSIHMEGYTAYDRDEGYYFVAEKTVRVNLVALSEKELAYVLDECMSQ